MFQDYVAAPLKVDGVYKCPYCPITKPRKSKMDEHIQIHTGEKPHECSICDYATNRKYNLKLHYINKHKVE